MRMRKVKLPVILALVTIVSAIGGTVADARADGSELLSLVAGAAEAPARPDVAPPSGGSGEPDVPSGIKRLSETPSSDGHRWRMPMGFRDPAIRRAWVFWVMSRWFAR
jgi:hypothetical protein